ncbi:Ldh family oxidoreductase [Arsenicitalea aurantiaca]|uniref:Ldh family oxidoreductase n=1 Tax=Arsenicitalea aurantiaca TaxID=1783274 RepID=A0A433XKF5_9HYPH|nr:Ldh family oxidoreductase [Arsenicitalea aurantiaca]RUT34561.1 Ldh family oxidoreductase [Arsenicitalea aurantiaca]
MPTRAEIEEAGMAALLGAGVPLPHARRQLDLLLEAELRGLPSHGLLRLPRVIERIANGVTDPHTSGEAHWRGAAFLEVEGRQGLGPVVAMAALDAISGRVAETGIAVAAIRNCDHLGMLAFYAEQVAASGRILIALTISEALVHPWGGRSAMLGTNPIAIGVPAHPDPFVFDMATSIVAMGRIHDHAARGEPIPEGWALDAEGNPTTDAARARDGALAPFGGPKGYALGLAFEVLVGSLTACALGPAVKGTLDSTAPCNKGDIFIVLEPATGAASAISAFLEEVRQSPPADPDRPVRVPGDRANQTHAMRQQGDIPLPDAVWQPILRLAGKSKV